MQKDTTTQVVFDAFLRTLNEAFSADAEALHALICNRVPCNIELSALSAIPVSYNGVLCGDSYTVGMLNIINGICQAVTGRRIRPAFSEEVDLDGRRKIIGFEEDVESTALERPDIGTTDASDEVVLNGAAYVACPDGNLLRNKPIDAIWLEHRDPWRRKHEVHLHFLDGECWAWSRKTRAEAVAVRDQLASAFCGDNIINKPKA